MHKERTWKTDHDSLYPMGDYDPSSMDHGTVDLLCITIHYNGNESIPIL
jgi:hypothetical protein